MFPGLTGHMKWPVAFPFSRDHQYIAAGGNGELEALVIGLQHAQRLKSTPV